MNERYLYAAIRYVERNPVRAGIVSKAWEYSWSSTRFHVYGESNSLLERCFLQDQIQDWAGYLSQQDEDMDLLREHERTGKGMGTH